jgi:hypothetical protein
MAPRGSVDTPRRGENSTEILVENHEGRCGAPIKWIAFSWGSHYSNNYGLFNNILLMTIVFMGFYKPTFTSLGGPTL